MRRTFPGRGPLIGAVAACAALVLTGAGVGSGGGKRKEPPPPKAEETIGDLANIVGSEVKVEGVGLVVGLDNTGCDPAPSWQRTKLINEMQKASIQHPENYFKSNNLSMVVVRATIPAGLTVKDHFDVEIELPPASTTTSLAGGWLVQVQLAPRAKTKDGDKDDKVIATALGPVMAGNYARPNDPKVGRVLGGGRIKEDAPYALAIKEARRSGKTSQLMENVINSRFHQVEGGDRKGMATAKTDAFLVLKVPKFYHHNQDRYHQVISLLSMVDNPQLREERLDVWGKDLLDPKKAGVAALRLEGLGPNASPTLKKALGSPDETVRFFAAESLAYLNENDGDVARVLGETARNNPDFRAFALRAMAATDQAASLLKLRALMNEPDFQLRYGAFNALRTLDPTDPFLGKVPVLHEVPEPENVDDMALAIKGHPRKKRKPAPEETFSLYVVDCEGPPMVHITRNLRCEIVLFGKQQKLLTPVVLGAGGPLLLNATDGDSQVQISKITSKTLEAAHAGVKIDSPLELVEVVREMANIGATYPEIIAILGAASSQKNLAGPLAVDAIPPVTPMYSQVQLINAPARKDVDVKKTNYVDKKKSFVDKFNAMFK